MLVAQGRPPSAGAGEAQCLVLSFIPPYPQVALHWKNRNKFQNNLQESLHGKCVWAISTRQNGVLLKTVLIFQHADASPCLPYQGFLKTRYICCKECMVLAPAYEATMHWRDWKVLDTCRSGFGTSL